MSSSDALRVGDHRGFGVADRTLALSHDGQWRSCRTRIEKLGACRIQVIGMFGVVAEGCVRSVDRQGAYKRVFTQRSVGLEDFLQEILVVVKIGMSRYHQSTLG